MELFHTLIKYWQILPLVYLDFQGILHNYFYKLEFIKEIKQDPKTCFFFLGRWGVQAIGFSFFLGR